MSALSIVRRLVPALGFIGAACSLDRGAPADPADLAVVLDGEAWISIPDVEQRLDLVPGGTRSVTLWLQYDRPQYHAKIFDKTHFDGDRANGYAAFVHQYSTSLGFWHRSDRPLDETGFTVAGVSGTRRIGDGAWHHIAIIQRDTLLEGWVDGQLEFVENLKPTLDLLANESPLTLGWDGRGVVRFSGAMDELTVWERALDRREIRRLMYQSPAPGAAGLTAYWAMDDTDDARVIDRGPHRIDGTATGISHARSTRPVKPPFTERTPVRFASLLLALALLYGVLRLYGLRLEGQKRRLERQVQDRVADLARASDEKLQALEVVAAQAERLEKLDGTRRTFFANISHEFRTPLSLIVAPLTDMLDRPQDASDPAVLRIALRNARRLQHLTEQLLELAQLESGALRLERRALDLGAFLRDLVASLQLGATQHQVHLDAQLPADAVAVFGDLQRLETIFANLITNAIRFTPAGGRVTVRLVRDGDHAVVTVQDEGPGIPADQAERIFERFFQTRVGIETGGGTGIGLALVRELTELHGGSVRLVPSAGRGATFRVELPTSAGTTAEISPPLRSLGAMLRPSGPTRRDGDDAAAAAAAATDLDDEHALRPLVLLVEDHAELRSFTRGYLARRFRVAEAADGQAALDLMRETLPDVVVSDVMMPRMDGFALLSAIRDHAEFGDVPVILLTARTELDGRLEGLSRGADAYLGKPFEPAELGAQVDALIAQRLRLRERLLAKLAADALRAPAAAATDAPDATSRDAESLRARMSSLIEAHFANPDFGVSELAAGLAMERTGLYRHAAELLGVSPSEMLRARRMTRAAELLDEGNTVAEVAYAVGYQSVSSFSRRFREHFSVPPGQWAGRSSAMP